MKLEIGQHVMIQYPCSGYSPNRSADLGPWKVKILEFDGDGFKYERSLGGGSSSIGTAPYTSIVGRPKNWFNPHSED